MVMHTINPITGEAEAGGSSVSWGQTGLYSETLSQSPTEGQTPRKKGHFHYLTHLSLEVRLFFKRPLA